MPANEEARAEVHAWVERLGELTSRMTTGQVLIEAVDRGRKELAVSRSHGPDPAHGRGGR